MVSSEEIFHQKTNYKKIILRFLRYKYYFVFAVVVAVSIAFILNKSATRKYSNKTTILINDEQRNSFLSSDDILQSGLFTGIDNVEDELALLASYPMIDRAVQEMNLEVSYFFSENLLPI